jgi:hypothetical protein
LTYDLICAIMDSGTDQKEINSDSC